MRSIELAKVAAAAEALRVKRFARRQAIRAALAVVAALFLLALFAMLHVLAVVLLAMVLSLWLAVLIVLAVDLLIGGIFGLLALNSTPDRVEREAAALRRQSLSEAKSSAISLATVGEIAGLAIGMVGRRGARSSRLGKAWLMADVASRFIKRR